MAIGFEPESRRGAARIRENRGALGDHGLADIYFRHGAAEPSKTLLNTAQDFFVAAEFSAEKFGDGFARAVVIGWAEAAAGDNQLSTVERVAEGGAHLVRRIADDSFVHHADAELVQLAGEEERIRIEAVGRKKLRADGNDLRFHREQFYSMKCVACKGVPWLKN